MRKNNQLEINAVNQSTNQYKNIYFINFSIQMIQVKQIGI